MMDIGARDKVLVALIAEVCAAHIVRKPVDRGKSAVMPCVTTYVRKDRCDGADMANELLRLESAHL